jgi:hypothetical protein
MIELTRTLAYSSAALLVAAVGACFRPFGGPLLQGVDGFKTLIPARAEIPSMLLMSAVGLSAVAAILAVIESIFR